MNEKMAESVQKTKICRLCLAYTKVYFSIIKNEKLSQMLEALTGIQVQPIEDIISMCFKCRLNLNLAYSIQQNMLKANEKFRTHNVKEEIVDSQEKDAKFELSEMCTVNKEEYMTNNTEIIDSKCIEIDFIVKEETTDFQCDLCKKYFPNNAALQTHVHHLHTKRNCDICGVLLMKGSLRKHMKSYHPQELIKKDQQKHNHKCKLCSKEFTHKWKLNKHKIKHERSVCPTCGKELTTCNVKMHMELCKPNGHTMDENNFTCSLCDKPFINESALKKHTQFHKRSKCPICHKDITTTNLPNHIRTHSDSDKEICEQCGATLKNKSCLRIHMIRCHSDAPTYKCRYCDKTYKAKTIRKVHELKEHIKDAKFVCDICGKKFYCLLHLRKHVDSKHLKLNQETCEVCKKVFSSRYALTTHRRIHTNETPYKCEVCGDGFRQRVSLKAHLKSKHRIKEELTHFCDVCDKGFGSAVALYSHQRVHS